MSIPQSLVQSFDDWEQISLIAQIKDDVFVEYLPSSRVVGIHIAFVFSCTSNLNFNPKQENSISSHFANVWGL
jgi:hypothetical protein